jgi:DNA repair protein SbcC/Rad50
VLINRLYLRNFRVYEDELDLEIPPGLVGIYGPNGAGKSALLEAVLFTLWGKSRTTKEQVRSAGVGGECVTEVEFEHEGHLYLVRRTLKGVNSAVTVEAHCDGALMSTGTRDAERYVESVLGMDDAAFRASVFTEQKQLAAFSNQAPADRRRLVLQLLGITPLDGARDAARKDARQLSSDHDRLRGMLPELATLETDAADADARAEAAEKVAGDEQEAARAAEQRLAQAAATWVDHDRRRQEYEMLVAEGKGARQELDSLAQLVDEQSRELGELEAVAARLGQLDEAAAGADDAARVLQLFRSAAAAAAGADRTIVPPEPELPAEASLDEARRTAAEAGEQRAAVDALAAATAAELGRAQDLASRSAALSEEADCPMCGQALGDAFEKVQAHRAAEVEDAGRRMKALEKDQKSARKQADQADAGLSRLVRAVDAARLERSSWEQAARRRAESVEALAEAWRTAAAAVAAAPAAGAGALRAAGIRPDGSVPARSDLDRMVEEIDAALRSKREAAAQAERIRGRLDRRPALEASLGVNRERAVAAEARVQVLRDKLRAVGFDPAALDRAAQAQEAAQQSTRAAAARLKEAEAAAIRDRARALAATETLERGREQHANLAGLEIDSRHVSRVADLLGEFRNTVVASVGPRLAIQAAELFGELTDHEYENLEVDPETYQLQIGDGGRLYRLDRFSGSEIDLANLALRVAISEHIHFQSGGSIGLLVLDEVFGPLDEDRRGRMLLALERLRGRFRQVLVVTHDADIKEQLPNAIEVVKLPGRRATARVLGE